MGKNYCCTDDLASKCLNEYIVHQRAHVTIISTLHRRLVINHHIMTVLAHGNKNQTHGLVCQPKCFTIFFKNQYIWVELRSYWKFNESSIYVHNFVVFLGLDESKCFMLFELKIVLRFFNCLKCSRILCLDTLQKLFL